MENAVANAEKKRVNNGINLEIIEKLHIFGKNKLFAFESFTKGFLAVSVKAGADFSYFFSKGGLILVPGGRGFGN